MKKLLVLLLMVSLFFAACGKKGAPRPVEKQEAEQSQHQITHVFRMG